MTKSILEYIIGIAVVSLLLFGCPHHLDAAGYEQSAIRIDVSDKNQNSIKFQYLHFMFDIELLRGTSGQLYAYAFDVKYAEFGTGRVKTWIKKQIISFNEVRTIEWFNSDRDIEYVFRISSNKTDDEVIRLRVETLSNKLEEEIRYVKYYNYPFELTCKTEGVKANVETAKKIIEVTDCLITIVEIIMVTRGGIPIKEALISKGTRIAVKEAVIYGLDQMTKQENTSCIARCRVCGREINIGNVVDGYVIECPGHYKVKLNLHN